MIKHIVAWTLKDHAHGNDKATNARLMQEMFAGLRGKIPGMLKLETGIDFSKTDASYDVMLYTEFESREALAGYQAHPEHKALMPFIAEARVNRMLVDYEV
ncbi:MAG: Dabb family protein [Cytophagales bacterium]|nr:Dabb family protein [Cytophagales bacterium]